MRQKKRNEAKVKMKISLQKKIIEINLRDRFNIFKFQSLLYSATFTTSFLNLILLIYYLKVICSYWYYIQSRFSDKLVPKKHQTWFLYFNCKSHFCLSLSILFFNFCTSHYIHLDCTFIWRVIYVAFFVALFESIY